MADSAVPVLLDSGARVVNSKWRLKVSKMHQQQVPALVLEMSNTALMDSAVSDFFFIGTKQHSNILCKER